MKGKQFHKATMASACKQIESFRVSSLYGNDSSLIPSIKKISREDYIKKLIEKRPVDLINALLPQIETTENVVDVTIQRDVAPDDVRIHPLIASAKVSNFDRITKVELNSFGLNQGSGDLVNEINDSSLILRMFQINSFNCHVLLNGYLDGSVRDLDVIVEEGLKASIEITGLIKNGNYGSWVGCLVDGFLELEAGNENMCMLNMYRALEGFVTTLHDDIIFEFVCSRGREDDVFKSNIRSFANPKKSLRNKLRHLLGFFEMGKKSEGFKELNVLINKSFEGMTYVRNSLAHGGISTDYKISEFVYNVLTMIFSIVCYRDLANSAWEEFILLPE